ncbi:DUF4870 domain-containing protein [Candidatus Daviesbacteria bacterium]|nr:DUF4870 domain-containing protein [Candidatus Daviesbacteria bacterium]
MSPQQPQPSVPQVNRTSLGLDENIEGLLCYVFGWITGLIFLLLEKNSRFVKFHAIQSLIVSVAGFILIIGTNLLPMGFLILFAIGPITFILWIVLMVKAYQGEWFKLPIAGEIALNQVNKQA